MTMARFSQLVNIPVATLKPYVVSDAGKRRALGSVPGGTKRVVVSADEAQFLVDVMRRKDRGDDGMSRLEAIDMLQDLAPHLSHDQAVKYFDMHIRPAHKELLTGVVKAEATTSKRSCITVEQQYRWHKAVDRAYEILRERNTGLTPDGKTFGEVAHHFVAGGDETCLLASGGDVKIIGDKEKKKHQVQSANSRTSITVYRSGTAAGAHGPVGFLPPGQKRKAGYDDAFLVKHGAPEGSTIEMTPTGYMTEEGWLEMSPHMADGLRKLPVICDMPHWWMVKIIDGFGEHTSSVQAMDIYDKRKILLLKEEGDASHVNQSYDQQVAKDDKRNMRGGLNFVRTTSKLTKQVAGAPRSTPLPPLTIAHSHTSPLPCRR